MDQVMTFNGVTIVFTTGQSMSEVQALKWGQSADIVLSIYPGDIRVLKGAAHNCVTVGGIQ